MWGSFITEVILKTVDTKLDTCGLVKKLIEDVCTSPVYSKKIDTDKFLFISEIEDKERWVGWATWDPYKNNHKPHLFMSTTIIVSIKPVATYVRLIINSID